MNQKNYFKKIIFLGLILISISSVSQTTYFPPTTGTTWDTLSPSRLNWCPQRIDSLYSFLQKTNTKGFIVLKDGKIVLEKYFGTFTADSFYYWASAGKSLTATLTGIAQEKGLLKLSDTVSNIIGNGWTSAPIAKERLITVRNLVTMTSGLDDSPASPCTNEDTTTSCLLYLKDAGTRWAYHTGAYRMTEEVIATAAGSTYTAFTKSVLGNKIGMGGIWINSVYYSKTRDAARFGLLTLNHEIWGTDTILHDTAYYRAMTNTSQSFNLSYGYLWWLNGKSSIMMPGIPVAINTTLASNAPSDMFCALGKNDQKIYVIPSTRMVVVRLGEAAGATQQAISAYDNDLWAQMKLLPCANGINESAIQKTEVYPNPFTKNIQIQNAPVGSLYYLTNSNGTLIYEGKEIEKGNFSTLPNGIYFLKIYSENEVKVVRLVKQ